MNWRGSSGYDGTFSRQLLPGGFGRPEKIYSYIAFALKENRIASNQVNRIRSSIRSLDTFPGRYAAVEWEPWASMGMHKLPVNNYLVFYLVDDASREVKIARIFYGGRDIEGAVNSEDE